MRLPENFSCQIQLRLRHVLFYIRALYSKDVTLQWRVFTNHRSDCKPHLLNDTWGRNHNNVTGRDQYVDWELGSMLVEEIQNIYFREAILMIHHNGRIWKSSRIHLLKISKSNLINTFTENLLQDHQISTPPQGPSLLFFWQRGTMGISFRKYCYRVHCTRYKKSTSK